MRNLLPEWLYSIISLKYNLNDIQEIRIRNNQVIKICYKGKYIDLMNDAGLYLKPINATSELIEYIISVATKQSMYAFDDQIKKGYIVTNNGIRIGLCGTAVVKNNEVSFIKKISSLNIRIAHKILGCSEPIINYLVSNGKVSNTLIVSSPGAGKTTLIRDIVEKLSNDYLVNNIMVIDEKFELGGEQAVFNLGANVDLMQGANKKFAFYEAIKVMNPSVIITDEIISYEDVEGILFAMGSGVQVIATIHADSLESLKDKSYIKDLIKEKRFKRIILLSKRNGVGTIEGVFNENFNALFLPSLI